MNDRQTNKEVILQDKHIEIHSLSSFMSLNKNTTEKSLSEVYQSFK